jgi:uncharacterized damage-inducible protein DinB
MNTEDVRRLYDYNRWANHRLLDSAKRLEPAEFVRDLGASLRSVQGTLVHILWAEWIWLRRWHGESPKEVWPETDYPDVAAVESRWDRLEREQEELIANLSDERLRTRIAYENLKGERWEYSLAEMMQHVVNHSSYHRGQIASLLRQLGHVPASTDLLLFIDELGATP